MYSFIILFNSKTILLILFISIKTALHESSQNLKYNISKNMFKKFNDEFDKFKGHSNEAKIFEEKHFNPIFEAINLEYKLNGESLSDLLIASKKFLSLDKNKQWQALKKTCGGHYCIKNSEYELNSSRGAYTNDSSILFIGNNQVKYTEKIYWDPTVPMITTALNLVCILAPPLLGHFLAETRSEIISFD